MRTLDLHGPEYLIEAVVWRASCLVAPPLGMLASAELFVRLGVARHVRCAKLHHGGVTHTPARCIFHCGHPEATT